MLLRTATASPFGRKCLIAAGRAGLASRLRQVEANIRDGADPLHEENPLSKMPVLTTDDGTLIFDSPLIIEYFDQLAGGHRLIPAQWPLRLEQLQMQALADGIMDAGALIVYEAKDRPRELWHLHSIERQRRKIQRGFAAFLRKLPDPERPQIGAIALACALGFIDRRGQFDWRAAHPTLGAWLDRFRAAAPEYDATAVPPEPGYVSP